MVWGGGDNLILLNTINILLYLTLNAVLIACQPSLFSHTPSSLSSVVVPSDLTSCTFLARSSAN